MFSDSRLQLRSVFTVVSLSLLVYTALIQLGAAIYELPYYLGAQELYFSDLYYYLGSPLIAYPAGIFAMSYTLKSLPRAVHRVRVRPGLKEIWSGFLVALGIMYLANYFTLFLLSGTETVDYTNEFISQIPLGYQLLTAVVLAPVFEELIFRRLLLDRLLFLGDWTALLLSSLFFGLFHTNLYQFFYAFAVGMVLGYVRIVTGSTLWNTLLHMAINLVCSVMLDLFGDSEAYMTLFGGLILYAIVYAIRCLIRRPWKDFRSGSDGFGGGEKLRILLTTPAFWVCLLVHLGLSLYYISM
ncbi:MAG: CPBP family intramembrane metalloprotease [Oscillospiraceae bacterium]|nr:CPBP family intramembrane metalloprotease [Oscillospiraceae bacterium]